MNFEINIELGINGIKITQSDIQILKSLLTTKSILQTSKDLEKPYKSTWRIVEKINIACKKQLILKNSKKCGTILSDLANDIIYKYEEVSNAKNLLINKYDSLSAQNKIPATINKIIFQDDFTYIECKCFNDYFLVQISKNSLDKLKLNLNQNIFLIFKINFLELENNISNTFLANIQDIQTGINYITYTLNYNNVILKASILKTNLKQDYKIGDKIKLQIPSDKIIIGI